MKKYLVTWHGTELEYNDSEIIEVISTGEAEQIISEGNEFAIDIYSSRI